VRNNDGTTSRQRYMPFGAPRGTPGQITQTDRGFLGKTEDDTTNLVQLDARYYDPTTAHFISVDPLLSPGDPQSLNAYAYAGGNPISRRDASGLCWLIIFCGDDEPDWNDRQTTESSYGTRLRVRGYYSKGCLTRLTCARNEARAQVLAMWWLTSFEAYHDDPISDDVHWEVARPDKRSWPEGNWRADIVHARPGVLEVAEVKEFGQDPLPQLRKYERMLFGLSRGEDIKRLDARGFIAVFRGKEDFLGDTDDYVAWGAEPGVIYFAKWDKMKKAESRGDTDLAEVFQEASAWRDENGVLGPSGGGSAGLERFFVPGRAVRTPVPRPLVAVL
jgi:RHS repeat-associated protein